MKDYKAIAKKQAEIIKQLKLVDMGCMCEDCQPVRLKLSGLNKELSALESQEVEGVSDEAIEKYYPVKSNPPIDITSWNNSLRQEGAKAHRDNLIPE